jgi:arylsulfatase A-like enzyme
MKKEDYLRTLKGMAKESRPNVVFVLVDSLRARNLGCYGKQEMGTPYIDRLNDEGFLFRQAFAQVPYTQPSTASIFTSLYPSSHGVNRPSNSFAPRILRLGEILRAAGYQTAAFVANPHINPDSGHLEGFQYATDGTNWLKRRIWHLARWGEDSSVLNRHFFRWFKREHQSSEPFLAFLFYIDPHVPFTSLPNAFHRFLDRKFYYPDMSKYKYSDEGMERVYELYQRRVHNVNRSVGELVRFLRREDVLGQTLFIFSADHGEGLDRRPGHWQHGGLYEKGLHIPLLVLAPWLGNAGKSFDVLIESIDILPSILELVGLPLHPQFQGHSFAPLLHGDAYTPHYYVAGEYAYSRYVRTRRWKYINKTAGNWGICSDWSEEKDLLDFEEVYDLDADPDEDRNLVRDIEPDTLDQLRGWHREFLQRLEERKFETGTYEMQDEIIRRLRGLGYLD